MLKQKLNRKRKQKPYKQKWVARLDTLASEYVRKRAMARAGGCERCEKPKFDITREDGSTFPAWQTLDWAHFRGKNKHSVRWDPSDAAGLCGGCHTHLDRNPEEKVEFFRTLLGQEEFDRLNQRAEFISHYKATDYRAWEIFLLQQIKELEGG